MKKELKWFKFDPAKWMLGRIMREPDNVQAVFLRLCCQYWFNQCKYSYDDAKYDTNEIIDTLIDAKIVNKKGNYIKIAFLDEQKTDAQGVSEVRKGAANERWRKQKEKDAMQTDASAYNIEEDKIREDKEEDKSKIINIEFEDFWNLYDKKIGDKTKIEKKWIALKDDDRENIIKYIPKYKISTPDKQYRKNPETFLNNQGWNDEIIQPTAEKKNEATGRKEKHEIREDYGVPSKTAKPMPDSLRKRIKNIGH